MRKLSWSHMRCSGRCVTSFIKETCGATGPRVNLFLRAGRHMRCGKLCLGGNSPMLPIKSSRLRRSSIGHPLILCNHTSIENFHRSIHPRLQWLLPCSASSAHSRYNTAQILSSTGYPNKSSGMPNLDSDRLFSRSLRPTLGVKSGCKFVSRKSWYASGLVTSDDH